MVDPNIKKISFAFRLTDEQAALGSYSEEGIAIGLQGLAESFRNHPDLPPSEEANVYAITKFGGCNGGERCGDPKCRISGTVAGKIFWEPGVRKEDIPFGMCGGYNDMKLRELIYAKQDQEAS